MGNLSLRMRIFFLIRNLLSTYFSVADVRDRPSHPSCRWMKSTGKYEKSPDDFSQDK